MNSPDGTTAEPTSEPARFYVFEFENEEITIPSGIDRISLINRIAEIDEEMRLEIENTPEPERFVSDFETQQLHIAEIARQAGIREGLRLAVQTVIETE